MNLPSIDLASLPILDTVTGLFGSLAATASVDDRLVVLMVYIYETQGGGFV